MTFTLHIDQQFKPDEKAIVVDSFMEWERDTHGLVKFVLSEDPWDSHADELIFGGDRCTAEVYVISMSSKDKLLKKVETNRNGTRQVVLGFTRSDCDSRYVAFVMDRLGNRALLRNVGVHEAGHLVGLDHIPVPGDSVMFPSMDKAAKCPTKLDMKQFCLIHECDWRDMVSCKVD